MIPGCLDLSGLKKLALWPGLYCFVMPEDERETVDFDEPNQAEDEDIPWDHDRNYEIGDNDDSDEDD